MNTLAALIVLNGYVATARRTVRQHTGAPGSGASEAGASTLELVIIVLGLMAVATLLVVAITGAVQRRVDQIN